MPSKISSIELWSITLPVVTTLSVWGGETPPSSSGGGGGGALSGGGGGAFVGGKGGAMGPVSSSSVFMDGNCIDGPRCNALIRLSKAFLSFLGFGFSFSL